MFTTQTQSAFVTDAIQLGGAFYPNILAPVPIGLVPQEPVVPHVVMDVPPDPLPLTVPATDTSLNPANWAHPV